MCLCVFPFLCMECVVHSVYCDTLYRQALDWPPVVADCEDDGDWNYNRIQCVLLELRRVSSTEWESFVLYGPKCNLFADMEAVGYLCTYIGGFNRNLWALFSVCFSSSLPLSSVSLHSDWKKSLCIGGKVRKVVLLCAVACILQGYMAYMHVGVYAPPHAV